jgi:long-chain fatty acid transport protein
VFLRCAITALSLAAAAQSAWATDGHQLIGLGALQESNGGAGVASPKDSTWVLLNPAGIVNLDRRFDFSFEYFMPYRYIEPHGVLMPNSGAGRMSDNNAFPIPAMGLIIPHGQGAFGVGLFAVNGMGVDYSSSRTLIPRLFGQNFDRRTQYGVMKLGLAYAYRFDNGWSVGATVNLDYAQFRTDMLTLGFWETSGRNRWDGSLGAGLTVGVYKNWDRWSFGAAYTTPQWMQTFPKYKDLLPDPLDLPQTVQTGVAYNVTPDVELLLDYKFINWTGVDQIARAPIKGGFGWKDQHVVKAGVNWTVNPKWTLRGGVSYGNSPITDKVVFANALFPAITKLSATTGVSYAITENSDIHFAFEHAFGNTMTDSGKGDLFSLVGKGTKIHLDENCVTVEYSHKF